MGYPGQIKKVRKNSYSPYRIPAKSVTQQEQKFKRVTAFEYGYLEGLIECLRLLQTNTGKSLIEHEKARFFSNEPNNKLYTENNMLDGIKQGYLDAIQQYKLIPSNKLSKYIESLNNEFKQYSIIGSIDDFITQ